MLPKVPDQDTLPEETQPGPKSINLQQEEPRRELEISPEGQQAGALPSDELDRKVQKAHFALGDASPGVRFMRTDFADNLERETRRLAAMSEAMKFKQVKMGIVSDLSEMAQAEGRAFSPEEAELVMGLSVDQVVDPETILEELYAKKLIRTGVSADDPEVDPTLANAMAESEDATNEVLDEGERTVTNQEIAGHLASQMKKRYDETSWARWGMDVATTTLFPLVQWTNITDVVESLPEGSTLTGDNVRETLTRLHSLPPAEFKREASKMLDDMFEDNVMDAMFMAQALLGYTNIDQQWDNDIFKADAFDVATLGAGVALKSVARLARRVRSISRVNTGEMTIEDGLAAAGNLEQGAVETAKKIFDTAKPQGRVLQQLDELGKYVPGMLDANLLRRNAGSLTAEAAQRIVDHVSKNRETLLQMVTDSSVLQRYGTQDADVAFEATKRAWRRDYYKLEDAIIEQVPVRESEEIYGGVDRIDTYLGRTDGTSFDSPETAEWFARNQYRLPKGAYDVVDYQGNWVLRMSKHVDETQLEVLESRLKTDAPETKTFIQGFIQHLGIPLDKIIPELASPDDIFSDAHQAARKKATFGGNRISGLMQRAAKPIGDISGKSKKRLQAVLERNHFEKREVTLSDGSKVMQTGNRYETIGDLQQGWKKVTGQLPTEKEIKAYYAFQDVLDIQWRINNISKYRDKARLGIENKAVSFMQELDGKMTRMTSPFFEGRSIDKLPHWGQEPFTVLWVHPKTGKVNFRLSTNMFGSEKKEIEKLLGDGSHQVIQTLAGGGKLRKTVKTSGEDIDYVIARDVQTKPLDPVQIEHRPGGHRRYADHGAYLKQPNVRFTGGTGGGRVVRNGDTTAHWDPSVKQMEKFGAAYETARRMILDGATRQQLNAYIKTNLPIFKSGSDFRRHFRGVKGSPEDAPFDIRSPFVVVRSRQDTSDLMDLPSIFGKEYVDKAKSEHNLGARIGSYDSQERSEMLTRIREEGTENNPVFKLEPAQIMDPLSSLDRAAQQLIRSRYFDDYRHMGVETWAERAMKYLKASPAEIRANPMKHLVKPEWKDNITDWVEPRIVQAQRRAILQLMGAEQESWGSINNAFQTLADGFAKARGKPVQPIVDTWRWTDPDLTPGQWARSGAFHAWLGLGNVKHLLLQASATMNMAAITGNPVRASQAVQSYMMMRRLLLSHDNKIPVGTKMLSKATGVDEDVFKEMYEAYRKTGMHEFQGENAQLDMYFKPRIIENLGVKALSWGQLFFREGNLISRGSSFAAAFLEHKAKFPHRKVTERDLDGIITRASRMSVDQTRDSINPIYEQGALKFPTQFFTFFSRLSDQMLGYRLTAMEKARMYAMYSAVYGVPTGTAGIALGRFWPFHEQAKEEMHRRGIDISESPILRFLIEGGLPIFVEAMTDRDVNVTESWGPGGLPYLRDFLRGETTTLDLLAGAAGSFYGELLRSAQPFGMYLADLFSPKDNDTFPIKEADFTRVLKSVSSVNAALGVYMAWQYGAAFTRGGTEIGERDVPMALLTAATGWQPKRIQEAWEMMADGAYWDRMKKDAQQMAMEEFRKGLWALHNEDDKETYEDYMLRARIILKGAGLSPLEANELFDRALRDNANIIESIERNYIEKGPQDQRPARHKRAYERIEEEFLQQEGIE